jgi:hypothetical protein
MSPVDVPPVVVNTTELPPVVRLFPAASFVCRVRVRLVPDVSDVADDVIMEVAGLAAPG